MPLMIRNVDDVDRYVGVVKQSAAQTIKSWRAIEDWPLNLLWRMKFELVGRHPIDDRELNLIEQVNQTWTYLAALEAARMLLKWHPDEVFQLAPGAHAALPFDIQSETRNVCAETFAAVNPRNNRKLKNDLDKLERHPSIRHRYIFFFVADFQRGEAAPRP